MNVSLWGIRNPVPAVLVFVVLCLLGLVGLRRLPIAQLPDVELPEVSVTVNLPGAAPSQLETEVTRKVEDAVASLADIDKLSSTINEGTSRTRILFNLGRDPNEALDEVRDAVERIRIDLPADAEDPIVSRVWIHGPTLLAYAFESDRLALDELSWFVDNTVRKALFTVPGVGTVLRNGGVDREVRVDIRPRSLQAYGLTAGMVSAQLARLQVELPGGRTTIGGAEQAVRTVATVRTAAELAEYPIFLPDGRSIRLSAIATVIDGIAEPREVALLDGRPVVVVAMQRSFGSSAVDVGAGVREQIARLAAAHPELRIEEVTSSVEDVRASYDASVTMLLEGALLAVIVVWFFLRDWRSTWISALALPLSVVPTFALMQWLDYSLNLLTLLAFATVIGVLVDDAIVEIENIAQHRAMGKGAHQAAIDATDEIGIAVIATSATLVAVFAPVALMPGEVGLYFRQFGLTAAAAVLFSLLVARLLTPMLAARFLERSPPPHPVPGWLEGYVRVVEASLHLRRRTLLLALAVFVASLALVPLIPTTFVPPKNASRTDLKLSLPPGVRLADTVATAEQARAMISGIPELESVLVRVGSASAGGMEASMPGSVRNATLTLRFRDERARTIQELEAEVRARLRDLPGARVSFAAGGPGNRLDIILSGHDSTHLAQAARNMEAALRSLPGMGSVSSTASLLTPEIVITPDPARAADLGVSTVDIAEAARIATSGDFRQRLAKLNLAERQVPIRVQLADESLSDTELLALLRVPARDGSVPLSAVATLHEGSGPAQIDRFDRERNIKVTAELNGQPLGQVMAELRKLPAFHEMPPGVRRVDSDDAEAFAEMFLGFGGAMLAGFGCVYLVLLLLFGSATQPLVILAAIPLCAAGAFGALLLTGYALSLPSLIGLLLLMGVATKNSILIVDYAIIGERDQGLSRHDAIIAACRKRARPVIMTTIAMGAGMLPIALEFGADGNFRAPLGIAVIGGLLTSTVLSLVVVPAAYAAMADARDAWRARRAARAAAGGRARLHGA
ncbi:MAG: efflux RND transporter permease subunit [Gammaproteobacteria bacterium]|nr:efflux RND transporter permease subunit [Gammaproteobacteria bacterium]